MHAFTSGGNKKYTNPRAVVLKSASALTLKVGKSSRIRATVKKQNTKKKLKRCTDLLRFMSTNTDVADVSLSGRILAKKKGKASIYVYAVNGVRKKVRVTVR